MDLAPSQPVNLTSTAVQAVPTGVWGPLGGGYSALLLGRSSAMLQGLFVLPGVIDADYTGEIKVMLWTSTPPCYVPAGARIAQLIYFRAAPPAAEPQERGG